MKRWQIDYVPACKTGQPGLTPGRFSIFNGVHSSVGRAPACDVEGHRFDPGWTPHVLSFDFARVAQW